MAHLWHLSLQTFGGIVGGATHYHVKLTCPTRGIRADVEWMPDEETVAGWNKVDPSFTWSSSSPARRFNDKDLATKAARRTFQALSEDGDVLLRCHSAQVDFPGEDRVIFAPDALIEQVREKVKSLTEDRGSGPEIDTDAMDDWWMDFVLRSFARETGEEVEQDVTVILSSGLDDIVSIEFE